MPIQDSVLLSLVCASLVLQNPGPLCWNGWEKTDVWSARSMAESHIKGHLYGSMVCAASMVVCDKPFQQKVVEENKKLQ